MMTIEGWIDEVENGRIYGRLLDDGNELEFDMALTDALECQRGYIEPLKVSRSGRRSHSRNHSLLKKSPSSGAGRCW
jgi:hypothetical protein